MMRLGLKQKNALLLLHFIELKFGLHTPAKTSYLKRKIEERLDIVLQPNNFLVSMHTLDKQGFVVYQPNLDKWICSNAKENENMWQLTPKGRQYAETLYSASLRPKRGYVRK